MKRSEIVEEAKQIVLSSGPGNVLEFGTELVEQQNGGQWTDEDVEAITTEARKQARRVYAFFGYDAPYAPCA